MHPESESSEVLSANDVCFMSVPMYCTKCMNMVQHEPLLQFFQSFQFEAVCVECSFLLRSLWLDDF